ncbi:hypothetical protein NDU88_004251 [Pleurodeles waltl]|uniref:Uncharacterized protein n=1 Tax=Pleurodeles waltl TaxID=8319 RepID=A0AAV7SI98_PLEWA|nr:hypothetical protein NDU88_004251 [Pleurodeles waltl]
MIQAGQTVSTAEQASATQKEKDANEEKPTCKGSCEVSQIASIPASGNPMPSAKSLGTDQQAQLSRASLGETKIVSTINRLAPIFVRSAGSGEGSIGEGTNTLQIDSDVTVKRVTDDCCFEFIDLFRHVGSITFLSRSRLLALFYGIPELRVILSSGMKMVKLTNQQYGRGHKADS